MVISIGAAGMIFVFAYLFSNQTIWQSGVLGMATWIVLCRSYLLLWALADAIKLRAYKQAALFEQQDEYYRQKYNKLRSTTMG